MKGILWCLILICSFAKAQKITWHTGSLLLSNQTVLAGSLSVDAQHDVILFKNASGLVDVYPALKVSSVFYFDDKLNINRRFVVMSEQDSPVKAIHEVVTTGEIMVYRKPLSRSPASDDEANYSYFVEFENNRYPISSFFYRVYPEIKFMMKDYVRNHELNITRTGDALSVILEYNKLIRKRQADGRPNAVEIICQTCKN